MAGREARAENLDPEFAHLHLEGAQRVAFHVEEGFAEQPYRAVVVAERRAVVESRMTGQAYGRTVGQRHRAIAVLGEHRAGAFVRTVAEVVYSGREQADGQHGGVAGGFPEPSFRNRASCGRDARAQPLEGGPGVRFRGGFEAVGREKYEIERFEPMAVRFRSVVPGFDLAGGGLVEFPFEECCQQIVVDLFHVVGFL